MLTKNELRETRAALEKLQKQQQLSHGDIDLSGRDLEEKEKSYRKNFETALEETYQRRLKVLKNYNKKNRPPPIDQRNQNVLHAAVAQLIRDFEPELGSFILLDPNAQHIPSTLAGDA